MGKVEESKQHMETNIERHLEMMAEYCKRQAEIIRVLESKVEEASIAKNGVLLWKIPDLKKKISECTKSKGLELVSKPFYSSPGGYKLQASLFLTGNGSGEGSHLSVYIKILPGEYDCILKWPFKQTVSFTLMDQNQDRNAAVNVMESFIPDPTWPNFACPPVQNKGATEEVDVLGFGFPRFLSHEMLYQRQYIKNDTLYLKIRADPKKGVSV